MVFNESGEPMQGTYGAEGDEVQNEESLSEEITLAISDIREQELRDKMTSYAQAAIEYAKASKRGVDMSQANKDEFMARMSEAMNGLSGHLKLNLEVRDALAAVWKERDAIAEG